MDLGDIVQCFFGKLGSGPKNNAAGGLRQARATPLSLLSADAGLIGGIIVLFATFYFCLFTIGKSRPCKRTDQ